MAADGMNAEQFVTNAGSAGSARREQSTHVRARTTELSSRAARRVAEYLKTLGLTDAERVRELAEECARHTHVGDADEHAAAAVAFAQERFTTWRREVFQGFSREPDLLWLRAFVAAGPDLFLADPARARAAAERFGDLEAGRGPVRAQFAEQTLEPLHLPSWLAGLLPPAFTTAGAASALLFGLAADGLAALELVWIALFTFLFGFAALGFFTALAGVSRRTQEVHDRRASTPDEAPPLPRTVLLMPIYHESAEHVFAAVAAMRESLLASPGGECFEIFVLSDSRDACLAADEERAFRRVTANASETIPVFYRRRTENYRQKAGNLQEFFERWGHRYEYAVVLDADSLMTGATLVELVRRMQAAPRLALLQAPIALTGGETLFARTLQFASSLCGPVFTRGLSRWSNRHANYYGHNAVIRVRAFLECCSLPRLDGEPPLGGHILSHDFVEAALLCRAGWEVRMADDLGGSFEGIPPTLPEFVARDRRWCQGNLQHLRVAGARGLRPMSRIHLLMGVAAYLAGPAWLAFLIAGVALSRHTSPVYLEVGGWVVWFTAALLFGPRLLGFLSTAADRAARRAHGGLPRLLASVVLELALSAALAPLLMLHHVRIVLSILFGRAVGWTAQSRRAAGGLGRALRSEGWISLAGLALCAALANWAPALVPWLAPIWAPWVLAIPLVALVSSTRAGNFARRRGLLLVASETAPEPIVERTEALCTLTASDEAARFRDLVLDPVLVEAHIARLPKTSSSGAFEELGALRQRALRAGPAGLSEAERQSLARDPESLRWLHREAWRAWPVESWEVSRERPQLPASSGPFAASLLDLPTPSADWCVPGYGRQA